MHNPACLLALKFFIYLYDSFTIFSEIDQGRSFYANIHFVMFYSAPEIEEDNNCGGRGRSTIFMKCLELVKP